MWFGWKLTYLLECNAFSKLVCVNDLHSYIKVCIIHEILEDSTNDAPAKSSSKDSKKANGLDSSSRAP